MNLDKLKAPFAPDDIEWRVGQAGKGDKVWARVLAYITSRAIMDRLDEVCGPAGWQTKFVDGDGHLQAGIGIRVGEEWVWKWDGTGRLDANDGLSVADAGKGDFSNALKRAAVQWGIGRYLYSVPEGWAIINSNGRFQGKTKDGTRFRWDPPRLPEWALPNGKRDPIIEEMERLWLEASRAGVGDDDEKDAAGMAAVERAISAGDVKTLRDAKEWLAGAIKTREVPA